MLKVSVENYCTSLRKFEGEIPETTKNNQNSEHGFGIRSIIHTAQKYDGSVQIYQEADRFILSMIFKIIKT